VRGRVKEGREGNWGKEVKGGKRRGDGERGEGRDDPPTYLAMLAALQKACRMMLFGLCSGRSSSANCYMRPVRGAVLSLTLIGSTLTHSCSVVNAVDSVRRTGRGLTNYLKTLTLLCLIKSSLTVVTSCINFYRHFRRLHRTIDCVIVLISSAYRTAQAALWIVTFLLGPCLWMFINTSKHFSCTHPY